MRLIDADELMKHVWRDKLDSRELIAKMVDNAPTVEEIPTKIPIGIFEKLVSQEPKTRYCKDCKWWKDSDGAFRRGIGAESRCPINREEVYEGNGFCYMFEPQESEE